MICKGYLLILFFRNCRMKGVIKSIVFIFGLMLLSCPNIIGQDFMPEKYRTITYGNFVRSFRFSPNGQYAAVTTGNNAIQLLDEGFNEIWSSAGNIENYAGTPVFSKDEKYLIFSKYASKTDIAVFDIEKNKVVQFMKSQKYNITDVVLSPDGKLLITGGDDRFLKLYFFNDGRLKLIRSLSVDCPKFQYIECVRFSPDGKYIAAAGIGTDIFLFSVNDTSVSPMQTIAFNTWTYSLTFSQDSKYLFSATSDSIYIWKLEKGKFVKAGGVECYGGETNCLQFIPSGDLLLAAKVNSMIHIFSWQDGRLSQYSEMEPHSDCILDISFSTDGLFMATASTDKTVIIWNLDDVTAWETKSGILRKGIKINADTSSYKVEEQGRNYLVLIGINNYTDWPKLNNAVSDAQAVGEILMERYGFDSSSIIRIYDNNATRKNILDRLSDIQQTLGSNDRLLIYYSGHGYYNKQIDEGYWIPYDAKKNEETDYLPNSTLVKYLKAINCRHIFLVVDACFSGSLLSDSHKGYVERVEQFRSRWCLSSGRLELVSDGMSGDHSPFANYFLKFLKENNKKEFPVSELIQYVKVSVSNNSEQTPIGSPLKNVGDEGGEYIFRIAE